MFSCRCVSICGIGPLDRDPVVLQRVWTCSASYQVCRLLTPVLSATAEPTCRVSYLTSVSSRFTLKYISLSPKHTSPHSGEWEDLSLRRVARFCLAAASSFNSRRPTVCDCIWKTGSDVTQLLFLTHEYIFKNQLSGPDVCLRLQEAPETKKTLTPDSVNALKQLDL